MTMRSAWFFRLTTLGILVIASGAVRSLFAQQTGQVVKLGEG